MTAWIKEEKVFAGFLAALILGLFLWNMMVRSPLEEKMRSQSNQRQEQAGRLNVLNARGQIAPDQLEQANNANRELAAKVQKIAERAQFQLDPRFSAGAPGAKVTYATRLIEVAKEVENEAIRVGCSYKKTIRDFGILQVPADDEHATELLIRLAAVHRVLDTAFTMAKQAPPGSLKTIEEITHPDLGNQAMGAGGGAPILVKGAFLNKLKIGIKFKARGEVAFRIIHALASPEWKKHRGALHIEDATFERPNMSEDMVDVSLTISALLVDVNGQLSAEAP